MKLQITDFDAIIFDLGGVIINIDYHATIKAFQGLNIPNFEQLYTQAQQNHIFDKLETGQLSEKEFHDYIRTESGQNLSSKAINTAWNAMLLDVPSERIAFLKEINQKVPIYLLSNTNAIHINWFEQYLNADSIGFKAFNQLFTTVHYSHVLEERKPNASCFNKVIEINQLTPEKTLFIDDSIQHIEGAQKVGLQTHHLIHETIVDLFEF